MPARTAHDLRCFCSRHPKLAVYGVTDAGEGYVHVKIWKQSRVFGEVVMTAGVIDIACRECLRWTQVTIAKALVKVSPDEPTPRVLQDVS